MGTFEMVRELIPKSERPTCPIKNIWDWLKRPSPNNFPSSKKKPERLKGYRLTKKNHFTRTDKSDFWINGAYLRYAHVDTFNDIEIKMRRFLDWQTAGIGRQHTLFVTALAVKKSRHEASLFTRSTPGQAARSTIP